jgi:hypothetical protein
VVAGGGGGGAGREVVSRGRNVTGAMVGDVLTASRSVSWRFKKLAPTGVERFRGSR